jgi:hypothetical protein
VRQQANHLATVKERGGLSTYHDKAEALLPESLCFLYDEVEGALSRFEAEAHAKANP